MSQVPQPQLRFQQCNGVRLAYFEWGQRQASKPTLLFVHATGFHGRVWDRVIEPLASEYHVVSLEQRGHGRSDAVAVQHWRTFGDDILAFIKSLSVDELIGVGHSMGAHALVDAAATSPAVKQLLLVDPTIPAPEAFTASADYQASFADGVHPASKRRRRFTSPQDMYDRLCTKASFPLFEPRVLRDYCEHGLQRTESGDYELLCKPEVEAQVYLTARTNARIYEQVARITVPVTVMRAKEPPPHRDLADFSFSPTWPGLASRFSRGRDIHLHDCSHFVPMQRPQRVLAQLRQLLQPAG